MVKCLFGAYFGCLEHEEMHLGVAHMGFNEVAAGTKGGQFGEVGRVVVSYPTYGGVFFLQLCHFGKRQLAVVVEPILFSVVVFVIL